MVITCCDVLLLIEQIKDNLSHDFVKCGYIKKTPSGTIKFQKRWFTLESDRLCYYEGTLVSHKDDVCIDIHSYIYRMLVLSVKLYWDQLQEATL